jgi:hypothetical protein
VIRKGLLVVAAFAAVALGAPAIASAQDQYTGPPPGLCGVNRPCDEVHPFDHLEK